MVRKLVLRSIDFIKNPEKSFGALQHRDLESVVFEYLHLLLLLSVAAAIANFLFLLIKTLYFSIFMTIEVDFLRFLNYALGQSALIALIFLIVGTFGIFLIAVMANLFIRQIRFTETLKIVLHACFPILLFGWIPGLIIALVLWSVLLFIFGVKLYKPVKADKASITHRD